MKQIKKMLLVSFLTVVSFLFFTSCGNERHTHNFVKGDSVEASCTENGYTIYKCDCGESEKRDVVSALGHSYGAWVVTKEATTSEKGTKEKTCTRCGDKVTEDVPVKEESHVHTYSSWEVATYPTAESTGLLTKNCTSLDDSKTHVLPALNETDYTVDESTLVLSTCTRAGSKEYVYTIDEQTFKFKVATPILKHTMVESSKEATCTEAGYVKNTCQVCGYEEVETYKAIGHTPVRDGHECEADKVCSVCHVVLEKKTQHKLSETLLEATCAKEGKITYTCDYCNQVIEEVSISKLEHNLSEFTDTNKEEATETSCLYKKAYIATCYECGEEVYKYEEVYHHTYELLSTKLATCTSAGALTYKCHDCENEITKALEVNGEAHNYTLKSASTDSKLVYECDSCHLEKTVLNHSAQTEATVSENDIKETKAIELNGNTSITLDDNILNNITTEVTIKANTVQTDTLSLSEEKKKLIGDNPVYDFELRDSSNNSIDFNNGKATIRIPYTLKEGENPTDIGVWYINELGETTTIKALYVDGYAIFETEHFSYYTVSKLTNTEKCELYGHHYIKGSQLSATCTTYGYFTEICSVCGDAKTTKISAIGHKFSQTSLTEATCLASGKRVETCANCSLTKEYFIPALGHNYVLDSNKSTRATCTHSGHEEYKCSRCDDEFTTDTMQLNHQYKNTIVDPTCTIEGYTIHKCLVCNEEIKDTYTAELGHNYIETLVNPTCTTEGYTIHACSRCNDTYKDNYVSARHYWTVETPTCGVGQECMICHTLGLPATNEHHYENGVCTLCGDGCKHTFSESIVKSTCTTDGYTLKTCSICGYSEKVNVETKLGHKGNLICDVCGKTIVSSKYVENLLTSALKYDSYTISGKDLKIEIVMPDTKVEVNISTITLNLKLDESGKLYGNGYIEFSQTQNETKGNATAKVYVKDGYFYMEAIESYYSNMTSGDYTYKHTETTYDEKSHYYRYKLDDLLNQMGISSVYDMINSIDSDTLNMISDALVKISTNEDYFVNKAIVNVLNKLFTIDTRSNEYKLSLNLNYFQEIYEYAKTHTMSEVIDYATSEDTFSAIYDFATKLNTLTVGDIVYNISETGLTLEEIITILNTYVPTGSVDKTFEDMINSYLNNNDQSLVQYLTSPVISNQSLFAFVKSLTNDSIDLTQYQSQLLQMLDAYKDQNIFDLVAPSQEAKKQMISLIDEYVNQYKDSIGLNIYTNKDGEVIKALVSIKGSVAVGSNATTDVDITLNTTFDNLVTVNQNLIDKIDELYKVDFKRSLENSNIELVKDEEDNVIGFVYSYTSGYEYTYNENQYRGVYTDSYKYVYQINFDNLNAVNGVDSDCNNWHKYSLRLKNEIIGTYVSTHTTKYYDLSGILVYQTTDINNGMSNCYSLTLFYNTKSKQVILGDDNNPTMHNFKLTSSLEASSCSEAGYNKYICSDCGYQKCEYYVNGHTNYTTTYELVNPNSNCLDGVNVIRHCNDCDKSFVGYTSYSHQTKSYYELVEGATSCEEGRIWVSECEVCGEKTYNYDDVSYTHDMDYKEQDLTSFGVNGMFTYIECKYCHTYSKFHLNVKSEPTKSYTDEATNTETLEYGNGNIIYSRKTTITSDACFTTDNYETTVTLKNKDTYMTFISYEKEYSKDHKFEENVVTEGLSSTVTLSCTKCGLVQEKTITNYYDSEFNYKSVEERYYYSYDSNSNLSYYSYYKYNYDEKGNIIEVYSEEKNYKDGKIISYRMNKSTLVNNKLVEVESSYIEYEAGAPSYEQKSLYSYDVENCMKITTNYLLRYKDGKLYSEEYEGEYSEQYHFEYTKVSEATCTQYEIIECNSCKNQITGNSPLIHKYHYYDEDGNLVCGYCGLVMDSYDINSPIVLEELDSKNNNIVVGYCYYNDKFNFSEPLISLIINGTSYDLDIKAEKTYTYNNKYLISGEYYISLDSIYSYINENSIQIGEIKSIELKFQIIEAETKTNNAITFSIVELFQ